MTIKDDAPLIEAARLLHGRSASLVVVLNVDGVMVGVITKSDVVGQISGCQGSSCMTAASVVMTRDVTFCHPHVLLRSVWERMRKSDLKHVPIVDRELRPLGVLNARQAVQALMEELGSEEELLREYVMGIGYR
ncbi:CBS domain-containing protein [Aureimonas glaciei]|uniref:CBS domain-containing protein n=1 Tax=Aureimonas glaciei TaxID=1776957 RepID=UPI001AEE0731|nr:CBS domain-containing protein [Aureimonas glaciei]